MGYQEKKNRYNLMNTHLDNLMSDSSLPDDVNNKIQYYLKKDTIETVLDELLNIFLDTPTDEIPYILRRGKEKATIIRIQEPEFPYYISLKLQNKNSTRENNIIQSSDMLLDDALDKNKRIILGFIHVISNKGWLFPGEKISTIANPNTLSRTRARDVKEGDAAEAKAKAEAKANSMSAGGTKKRKTKRRKSSKKRKTKRRKSSKKRKTKRRKR